MLRTPGRFHTEQAADFTEIRNLRHFCQYIVNKYGSPANLSEEEKAEEAEEEVDKKLDEASEEKVEEEKPAEDAPEEPAAEEKKDD